MTVTDIEAQMSYLNYRLRKRPTVKNMKKLEALRLQHEQLVKEMGK